MDTMESSGLPKDNSRRKNKKKSSHEQPTAVVVQQPFATNSVVNLTSPATGSETEVEEAADSNVKQSVKADDLTADKLDSVLSYPPTSQSTEQLSIQGESDLPPKRKKKKKKKKKKKSSTDDAPNVQSDINHVNAEHGLSSTCSASEGIADSTLKVKKKSKKKKKKAKTKSSDQQELPSVPAVETDEIARIVEAQISVHPDEEIVCDIHIRNSQTHPLNFDLSVPSKSRQSILTRGPEHLPVLDSGTKADANAKQDAPNVESSSNVDQETSEFKSSDSSVVTSEDLISQDNSDSSLKFDSQGKEEIVSQSSVNQEVGELSKPSDNLISSENLLTKGDSEPELLVCDTSLESTKPITSEPDGASCSSEICLKDDIENCQPLAAKSDVLHDLSTSNEKCSDSIESAAVDEGHTAEYNYTEEVKSERETETKHLDLVDTTKIDSVSKSLQDGINQDSCVLEQSGSSLNEPEVTKSEINLPEKPSRSEVVQSIVENQEIESSTCTSIKEDQEGDYSLRVLECNLTQSHSYDITPVLLEKDLTEEFPLDIPLNTSESRDNSKEHTDRIEAETKPCSTDCHSGARNLPEQDKCEDLEKEQDNLQLLLSPKSIEEEHQLGTQKLPEQDQGENLEKEQGNLQVVLSPKLVEEEAINTDRTFTSEPATMHANETKLSNQSSGTDSQQQGETGKTKAQLKAERRAAFEAQKAQVLASKDKAKEQKSKAELRAERRALQEAQRAAKMGAGTKVGKSPSSGGSEAKPVSSSNSSTPSKTNAGTPKAEVEKPECAVPTEKPKDTGPTSEKHAVEQGIGDLQKEKEAKKIITSKRKSPQRVNKIQLFAHLPRGHWEKALTKDMGLADSSIHPSIVKLGLQLREGIIRGSNARCVALLLALKQVIKDYTTPSQKEMARDLESRLKKNMEFLCRARPLSVSMTNAIKYVQWQITCIPSDCTDSKAKDDLTKAIDKFIREEIELAKVAISDYAREKINDGDVILTFSCSTLVCRVLCDAKAEKNFHVIVVDARPKLQGREMLRKLLKAGISCSYVFINAVSYVMQEVTKVMLGAHSLQANGYVMSHVGSSQISLVAHAYNVPVLVCCETYKFSERVQTDSFVYNELGDPSEILQSIPAHKRVLDDIEDTPSLQVLNLVYDITPPDFVSVVITEKGMLPCTSVPAVLRVKQSVVQDRG